MNLVERVKAILLQPKSEWPVIAAEPGDAGYLFTNYVCIVSAIPPVCSFIGGVIIGYGPYHIGLRGRVAARDRGLCARAGRRFRHGLCHRLPRQRV